MEQKERGKGRPGHRWMYKGAAKKEREFTHCRPYVRMYVRKKKPAGGLLAYHPLAPGPLAGWSCWHME